MFDERDPRTNGDYVRRVPGEAGDGDVIVTGVVHDHPASMYRVRSVVEGTDPDVLALELPPLAVPLFERYADERGVPTSGDEMSVAIRAATTDSIEGIDGPSPAFLRRLAWNLLRNDPPLSTVRNVLRGLLSVSKHAVACRIAASFDEPAATRLAGNSPVEHEVGRDDDPERQAADERTQIRRAKSVLSTFGKSTPVQLRDQTREAHMAARLESLRRKGTVVAVVGVDHLEPLVERLQ